MTSSEWYLYLLEHGKTKVPEPSVRILGAVIAKAAEELSARDKRIQELTNLLHNAIIKSGEQLK